MTDATDMFDVLIVGGGPVGACMGALLARGAGQGADGRGPPGRPSASALRVGVIEPNRPRMPAGDVPIDPRVVAVSRSSERILRAAGSWERVSAPVSAPACMTTQAEARASVPTVVPRLNPYERMRIWHESVAPSSSGALVFDAADVGEPNLGYIVENRVLQAALLDTFADAGGVIESAQLVSLHVGADSVSVETSGGKLAARLVVGADGALSSVVRGVRSEAHRLPAQTTARRPRLERASPPTSHCWSQRAQRPLRFEVATNCASSMTSPPLRKRIE